MTMLMITSLGPNHLELEPQQLLVIIIVVVVTVAATSTQQATHSVSTDRDFNR
jgi:hypothetical protein